jgi:hypothetical protein
MEPIFILVAFIGWLFYGKKRSLFEIIRDKFLMVYYKIRRFFK